MNNTYTLPFDNIHLKSKSLVGGKGASLVDMYHAGIQIPQGFVITTRCFKKCLSNNKSIENIIRSFSSSDFKNQKRIVLLSRTIRKLVEKSVIPDYISEIITSEFKRLFKSKNSLVAVRSSAVSEDSSEISWAGELESYLNVNFDNLFESIKKCWSSIFAPRALYYRYEHNIGYDNFEVAVVIQKMVQSKVAGVAFTVNPINKNDNELIIEAGYGLGEAVVLGHITPDKYILDKANSQILEIETYNQAKMLRLGKKLANQWFKVPKKISSNQKLTGKEIVELCEICKLVEEHFGFPCDIEWAFERENLYVVQSRPITTLR